MKQFSSLFYQEWRQSVKPLLAAFGLIFMAQIASVVMWILEQQNRVAVATQRADVLTDLADTHYSQMFWLAFPLTIGAMFLFYWCFCAYIWYRDWLGQNRYIIRLLTLPIPRYMIYVVKFSVMVSLFCIIQGLQLVLNALYLLGAQIVLQADKNFDLLATLSHTYQMTPVHVLWISDSLFVGLLLLLTIVHVFQFVLIERSRKVRGAFAMVRSIFLFGLMVVLEFQVVLYVQGYVLTRAEAFTIGLILSGIVLLGQFALSYYLLNKKISI